MEQNPMKYSKKNIAEIMDRPVRLFIGPANNDEIIDVIEGIIVHCDLASNPPHLPAVAEIKLNNGKIRRYSFPELKKIEIQ